MHAGSWERSSCLARHPQTTGEPVRQPYTCRPTWIGSGESDVNPAFNFKRRKWRASDFDLGLTPCFLVVDVNITAERAAFVGESQDAVGCIVWVH